MKLIKKLITIIITITLLLTLTACGSYESKAKNNIDAYMKTMKGLTSNNYISWVNENLGNPYSGVGLDLGQLREGQITYFINCLPKVTYEITNVDETNKMAEVKVSYIDSTEYITNTFNELLTYAFSEDYTEEGENQIYIDVMNSITEDKFIEDTIYFSLNDDASIGTTTSNTFDVATAGLYKLMLGDPDEIAKEQANRLSADELLENIDISYEVFNESYITVKFTNNNEVAVNPLVRLIFTDKDGNYVIESQASIEALPAGATNFSVAYNELNGEDVVDFHLEKEVSYYEDGDITFFDESLVPYEIKAEEGRDDEIHLIFTNNTDQTIDLCGGYIVYDEQDNIMNIDTIYLTDIAPGQSDYTWFYLPSDYNDITDTITITQNYGRVEVFPIAHTYANAIWTN